MPDPFSIALGVVQVADTGFKLAESIYTYTNSVRKAEKQLRPIADYVKTTSTALEEIASHLKDDELRALYKPALLERTEDALKGCEAAFEALDKYIRSLTKDPVENDRGVVSTKTKLTWRWKQKELDSHQVRLECYKSTFNVLLGTLTFISSSRIAKDSLSMKARLQELIDLEKQATQKELESESIEIPPSLRAKWSPAPTSLERNARGVAYSPALTNNTAIVATPFVGPNRSLTVSNSPVLKRRVERGNIDSEDVLLVRLNECAAAVDRLSETLHDAVREWENSRKYTPERLLPEFKALQAAIEKMPMSEKGWYGGKTHLRDKNLSGLEKATNDAVAWSSGSYSLHASASGCPLFNGNTQHEAKLHGLEQDNELHDASSRWNLRDPAHGSIPIQEFGCQPLEYRNDWNLQIEEDYAETLRSRTPVMPGTKASNDGHTFEQGSEGEILRSRTSVGPGSNFCHGPYVFDRDKARRRSGNGEDKARLHLGIPCATAGIGASDIQDESRTGKQRRSPELIPDLIFEYRSAGSGREAENRPADIQGHDCTQKRENTDEASRLEEISGPAQIQNFDFDIRPETEPNTPLLPKRARESNRRDGEPRRRRVKASQVALFQNRAASNPDLSRWDLTESSESETEDSVISETIECDDTGRQVIDIPAYGALNEQYLLRMLNDLNPNVSMIGQQTHTNKTSCSNERTVHLDADAPVFNGRNRSRSASEPCRHGVSVPDTAPSALSQHRYSVPEHGIDKFDNSGADKRAKVDKIHDKLGVAMVSERPSEMPVSPVGFSQIDRPDSAGAKQEYPDFPEVDELLKLWTYVEV